MKIKRFKNLWLMGLILSGAMLGAIYLAKIISPQFVIEFAQVDSIVKIGHYIDKHKLAWYFASAIISFFIYYLSCCASCKKRKLSSKELIIVCATIIILFLIKEFLPNQYMAFNVSSTIILPFIMKADFKATTIVFSSTTILQSITLEIRNIAVMVTDFNFASSLILTIDLYILLFLLYFYFNFENKKEN